jgi:hypothetical protein
MSQMSQMLPYDIVLNILQYDNRFVIKNGKVRVINKIQNIIKKFYKINTLMNEMAEYSLSYSDNYDEIFIRLHLSLTNEKIYLIKIYTAYYEEFDENGDEIYIPREIVRKMWLCQTGHVAKMLLEY